MGNWVAVDWAVKPQHKQTKISPSVSTAGSSLAQADMFCMWMARWFLSKMFRFNLALIFCLDVLIWCSLLCSKVIPSEPTCMFTCSWKAIHLAAGKWLPGISESDHTRMSAGVSWCVHVSPLSLSFASFDCTILIFTEVSNVISQKISREM